MPNTLVHFAVQGAASRALWRRPGDAWFIYVGCLLPDLPWIVRRAAAGLGLDVDPFDLRLYTMAQASLAGTLLLCAALAAASRAPRRVFGILGLGALVHLLVDASEAKWGNGVHLLAPFSWHMTSFALVPVDSLALLVPSAAGALLVAWEFTRQRASAAAVPPPRRPLLWPLAFLAAYGLAPLLVLAPLEASDSYSVGTLRAVAARPGRMVRFDRAAYLAGPPGTLLIWTGERLRATGRLPQGDGQVSVEATFLAPDLLRVERVREHRGNRDWPSYLGLLLLALLWWRAERRGLPGRAAARSAPERH